MSDRKKIISGRATSQTPALSRATPARQPQDSINKFAITGTTTEPMPVPSMATPIAVPWDTWNVRDTSTLIDTIVPAPEKPSSTPAR